MLNVSKSVNTWNVMHSNFITPPDLVQTVLIIDANTEQVNAVAAVVRESQRAYNIYLYHNEMNDSDWLFAAIKKSDVVLQMQGSPVLMDCERILVGMDQEIKTPVEYFTK